MKIKVYKKNPSKKGGRKMAKKKHHKKRHHNAARKAITIINRAAKKHHYKRRHNPAGIGGAIGGIFNKEAFVDLLKVSGGGALGLLLQSKGLDKIGVTGPAKGALGIMAALVAPKVIPDRKVSLGLQAVIGMRILQQLLESQGITAFSGADRLTAADVAALNRLTARTMGEAMRRPGPGLMGAALPPGTMGEAMRRRNVSTMGEAMRRGAGINPKRTLEMLGMQDGADRYETIEL